MTKRKFGESDSRAGRLVVALDWGTTFSGIGFVYASDVHKVDNIEVVKDWRGSNHSTSEKCPSQILFDNGNVKWGYELGPCDEKLQYLKLLLDPKQSFPHWTSRATIEAQLQDAGKTAVQAVAEYLGELVKDANESIVARYSQTFVDQTLIDYVITVPAVWEDSAKEATRVAASTAIMSGLKLKAEPTIKIVPEPEAAAIYALTTLRGVPAVRGDVFVLCDAGGGTVDLSTFQIIAASGGETHLKIKEFIVSDGGLCGGSFINQAFEQLLEKRLDSKTFTHIRKTRPEIWSTVLTHFEDHVKQKFGDAGDDKDVAFRIAIPDVKDSVSARIKGGFMSLSTADVRALFQPVVDDILTLLDKQVTAATRAGKAPKAIIMVGGFSASPYLMQCVRTRFTETSYRRPIVVVRSIHTWTTVLRGAVMCGIPGIGDAIVASRKAKASYGVAYDELYWSPEQHTPESRYYDPVLGCERARNVMRWLVKRGQTIDAGQEFEGRFFRAADDVLTGFEEVLYVSKAEKPPAQLTDGVKVLCSLDIDTSALPAGSWKRVGAKGAVGAYQTLNFDLQMKVYAAHLEFGFTANRSDLIAATATFE